MSSTPYGHYPRKTVRDAPLPRQGRQAGVCTRIASARLYPETMTPFPEKMPFRGSVFFRVFRVFRGFENIIRAPSCPLVVLSFFRAPSWFCFFPCVSCVSWFNPLLPLRGFEITIRAPSCPFVVLRFFRAPSWFCFFRVFRVFNPPCPPGHDYDDYLSVCLKNAAGAASWGGRSGEYSPLPSAPSTLHP